jgi:hypothetical protein
MESLKGLLTKARREYEARKPDAEARVVRWEHWSGPAYDPKPYYFERGLRGGVVKRGKPVPKATARGCSYGFDAEGRVVIDRQPKSPDEPAFDEFFTYSKAGIESAAYERDGEHALRYVTRQVHRAGQPVSTDVLDANGGGGGASYAERYGYRDGRLASIDVTSVAGKEKQNVQFDLVYERDGRLRAIRRLYYDSLWFPIYWNPASGETLESLTEQMRATLLKLIPDAVKRAKIRKPAYCLAIAYDTGNDELPPLLGVGLEEERAAWMASQPKAARDMMWNPDEFKHYAKGPLDLTDVPGLADDSQKLLQMVLMKEALWVPRRLLNEIAAELNERSWRGILPTTDDFIVYAVDVDGDDDSLKKNLKAGVPEAKRKLLRSRKML